MQTFLYWSLLFQISFGFNCKIPNGCRVDYFNVIATTHLYEKMFLKKLSIQCELKSGFPFEFDGNSPLLKEKQRCNIEQNSNVQTSVILKWQTRESYILDSTLKIYKLLDYLSYFYWYVYLNFMNLKGFDVNLLENNLSASLLQNSGISSLVFVNCKMSFYFGKEKVQSCQDFKNKNISAINSIFQITKSNYDYSSYYQIYVDLINCEFKQVLCPLVYKNSDIKNFRINNLANTFYKKNLLQFSNEQYSELNSKIKILELLNSQNIDLDLNLLNPSAFGKIEFLFVYGSINSITNDLYKSLEKLRRINFSTADVRKMFHKIGIQWIKQFNPNLNVNLNDTGEIEKELITEITFNCEDSLIDERISNAFPDEDFCIYKDYPFHQLVFSLQLCLSYQLEKIRILNSQLSCTYLWLTQYAKVYLTLLSNDSDSYESLLMILESDSYKNISKCNFSKRLDICTTSYFQVKDIWTVSDSIILNKKLQTAIKILTYFVSLFGLLTNLIVIKVFLLKKNKELFKNCRQYTFLVLNSLFNLLILIIQILSWINECFFPFQIYCPEIRKLIFVQFFQDHFQGIFSYFIQIHV